MRFGSTATFALCALLSLATFDAAGQTQEAGAASNLDVLRDKLAADKKLVVATNLTMTDSQAKAFWPIYDEYQQDLRKINERTAKLILDYAAAYKSGDVTDAKAKQLLDEAIAIDEAEVAVRKTYAGKLTGVLPMTEAARYMQIENKIRAVAKYDMAEGIPLVE